MNSEALLTALRTGDMTDVVTILAGEADELFFAREGLALLRLGSTNIYASESVEFHPHPTADRAAECLAWNRREAIAKGYTDTGITPAEVQLSLPRVIAGGGERQPDELAMVNGRPAEIFYA